MGSKKVNAPNRDLPDQSKLSLLNIIAVGASAGGLEALQEFLSHLPELKNTCIIVAQHLSPTHKSMLVQLLSRKTGISVAEAAHGAPLQSDKIYVTPPDKEIIIVRGKIHLQKPASAIGPKPSVDVLFKSLSAGMDQMIIGVILSGTGTDGAAGVRAIKRSGGHVVAQEPETAKYNGMPLAAINTGVVDAVLAPEKIGEEIAEYLADPLHVNLANHKELESVPALKQILQLLSKRTGADFSNYKLATINRRLEKRMSMLKLKSLDDYLKVIEKNPQEAEEMFNTILIGVTSFFRDMEAFGALEDQLHKVINAKTSHDPIRIWAPGCSTGEEAYSIAILLHRILKDRLHYFTIQIFATDIDERAIAVARAGIYKASSLSGLPAGLIDSYFIKKGEDEYELEKSIRSMVLFSRHNVVKNPPFLKVDLICCRNLLIYFNSDLQQQIIPIFHHALNSEGYLFLGKSETVGHFSNLFSVVDSKNKIYQRRKGGGIHSMKFSAFKPQNHWVPESGEEQEEKKLSLPDLVRETLYQTFEHPYVVVSEEQDIREVNGDVRLFMSLTSGSIQVNLIKMVNPELQTEVRTVLMKAIKLNSSSKSRIKRFELFGVRHFVRIHARPLIYAEGTEDLYMVIFEKLDIEEFIDPPKGDSEEANENTRIRELEVELAATREQLQTYIEEIETSNEELQSLNEEMQSANEELQSTNEELETSSEELQSSNEEIQIAYTELKSTHEELERKEGLLRMLQADTESLLNNDLQALVMVDASYKIMKFNRKALEVFHEIMGKRMTEGYSFIDLLPEDQVNAFIRDFKKATAGGTYQGEREFLTADGSKKWYSLNYSPVVYEEGLVSGICIGLLDLTDLKIALSNLNATERLVNTVFNTVSTGISITDENGRFVDVNDQYCRIYGYTKEELIGKKMTITVAPGDRKKMQVLHDDFIKEGKEPTDEFDVLTKSGEVIKVSVNADLLIQPDGSRFKVTSVADITTLKETESSLAFLINNTEESFILMDKELKIITFNRQFGDLYKQYFNIDVVIGDSILKYAQSERKEVLRKVYTRVLKGANEEVELTIPVPEADPRTFFLRYKPAKKPDGQIVGAFVSISDITEKKKATDQLVLNEKRFRSLVENSGDAVALISPEGTTFYVSPSVKNVLGYSEEEAMQLTLASLMHPDDMHLVSEVMHRSFDEPGVPQVPTIARARHQDGSWRWVEATITNMLHEPAINGIVDNFRDVTDRVEAEMQLRKSEAYLMEAQRLAKMGSWNFDIETNKLTWTEAMYHVFGVNKSDFVENQRAFMDFMDPEDREFVLKTSRNSQETGEPFNITYRISTSLGEKRIIEEYGYSEKSKSGKIIRLFGTAQDITERIKAEEQIRLSNERFQLVNKLTNDAIYDWDVVRNIFDWGEGFTRIFGHQIGSKPFRLSDWSALMHPDDDERDKEAWDLFMASKKETRWNKEFRFQRSDGSYAWVEEIGHLIRDEKGKPKRMIGVLRDVSAAREAEIQQQVRYQVAQHFKEDISVMDTLKNTLKFLAISRGYKAAEIWLISRNGKYLTLYSSYSEDKFTGFYQSKKHKKIHFSKGEGLPGSVWDHSAAEVWDRIDADKKFVRRLDAKKFKLKSAFGLPLSHNDTPVGVLVLLDDKVSTSDPGKTTPYHPLGNFLGAEIRRKQQEEEMFLLFQSAPDILSITSPDRYFLKVNPAFCELTGYSEEELTSFTYDYFIHPDDLKVTIREFNRNNTNEKKTGNFINRLQTKNGSYRWISWNSSKVFGEEGHVFSYGRDVTEIRELQNLLDNASKLARVGGWEVDLVNNKVFWSQITRKIHEVESGYVPDLETVINFYRKDVRDQVKESMDNAVRNGKSWDFELPIITTRGNERWIRSIGHPEFYDGECIRIYGSYQDIHTRKLAELDLAKKTEYLSVISNVIGLLLQTDDWYKALNDSFSLLGETVGVDRVYYFENHQAEDSGDQLFSQRFEWSSDDTISQIDNPELQNMPFEQFSDFVGPLGEGKPFMGIVSQLPDSASKQELEAQDVLSVLVLPIFIDGVSHGFIGFDDCTRERVWTDDEISFLQTITFNLSSAIMRRKNQETLRLAFEEKNTILESIGDAFFAVDRDFTVNYWNHMAEKMLRTPREKILGKNLWDVFKDAKDHASYKNYHRALKDEVTVHFEDYYEPVRRWFEISAYPSVNGLTVYFKDITEKKNAQEQIRQSNERFEKIAEATNDAVWDFDVAKARLFWGKGFNTLFGYDPEGIKPTFEKMLTLIHPDDRERIAQKIRQYMTDGKSKNWFEEYRFLKSDGSYAFVIDRAIFMRNKKREVIRVIGAMTDISYRREFEESLRQLNQSLEQKARELALSNAELEQFAYVASHDLQEPLRMVTGFLTQLERKYGDQLDKKAHQYIDFAVDGAGRMRQIILDLLNLSRVGRHEEHPEELDMGDLVREVLTLTQKLIREKEANVVVGKLPVIHSYRTPMIQVFQNLIGNALKYSKSDVAPVVKIRQQKKKEYYQFSVEDNGIGIDQEYFEKIFIIFQRLHSKDKYSGTGMGLALVKKIVENLGGNIWLESELGKGSTFYFTLPITKGQV